MKNDKWTHGQLLEPGGHRIFREYRGEFAAPETLRWAIADNSGQRPDTTEDGILWLDFRRPLEVRSDFCGIPVRVERDGERESRCPCGIDALLTLKKLFPNWKLDPGLDALKLLQLFASPAAEARDEPLGADQLAAARARAIDAGISLVTDEYGQGGVAAALLSFIEGYIAYRSDGDLTDQANYAIVSELRAIDEHNICGTPRDNPQPVSVKVFVISVRGTNVLGDHDEMSFTESHAEALEILHDMLGDAEGEDGYNALRARVTPVEIPNHARIHSLSEWLHQHKSLWAAE